MDDVIRPNRTALPAIVISGCVKHPNLVGEIGINGKNTENGGAECEERASLGDNNVEKGVRTAFLSEGGGPHFFFFFFFSTESMSGIFGGLMEYISMTCLLRPSRWIGL